MSKKNVSNVAEEIAEVLTDANMTDKVAEEVMKPVKNIRVGEAESIRRFGTIKPWMKVAGVVVLVGGAVGIIMLGKKSKAVTEGIEEGLVDLD